ncbi:MAG TPA: glutamate-5-semialdehyde dehydrogenase [Candidatus Limnocylindrales bacterium]|nr:glutamate-5-semialdehyde dehydrogenase [Candidatus Limnocylindrales bacterium]
MPRPTDAQPPALAQQVRETRRAARALARMAGEERNRVLLTAADLIEARCAEILAANQADCEALAGAGGEKALQALMKRLKTSAAGVREMAARVRDVARLEDPLAHVLAATELDDDLVLRKVPCPLGVIAVIFEARPDVAPQVGSLAIKTGNGLVLKGGMEARLTNRVLVAIWREALAVHNPALTACICLLEERAEVMQVLQMEREIDLVVPRGSTEFVNFVFEHSRIPVLGHGSGICHIYVDSAANPAKSKEVILDAKVQYPAACNSVEKVLVHEDVAAGFLPDLVRALQSAGVEVRGCEQTVKLCPGLKIIPAVAEDWDTEYSDLKITVKVVSGLQEAIDHIDRHGSRHTECIMTEDASAAAQFLDEVDAASVFHNASTRFADGFRYGLGAEIGISNSKLHARGPVGMEGLLTYKYKLHGKGQTVGPYAEGKRKFRHRRV